VEPVVKADAYGHGMIPVALALVEAGADGLCVAALDEAIALRDAGVGGRLTVLYPVPPSLARLAAERSVAVAAGDPELLRELLAAAGGGSTLDVELEVESGLGRGGARVEDVVAAARAVASTPGARLAGVWTHLQASEDPARTAGQVERYEAALAALGSAGIEVPRRHVAASGALLTQEIHVYDAVRPGLMTYGLLPDELSNESVVAAASRLRPVMSLVARPVRAVDLPAGHGISYGPTFETGRPSRIATLPLGYGDGWPRSLSNNAQALVRGVRAPIVGNVAMDAVMVDVTDVPGAPVGVDNEFVLLGAQGDDRITAADLARARTTNSWEVVTTASARLPRVYDASAGAVGLRTLISGEDRWLRSNSGMATSATSRSMRS
jgi:alanine racemase